jgi:hypothetical protein
MMSNFSKPLVPGAGGGQWVDDNKVFNLINWDPRRDGDPSLLTGTNKAFYVEDCGYRTADDRDFIELTTDNTNRNGWVYFDLGSTSFKTIMFEIAYTSVSTETGAGVADGIGICPALVINPVMNDSVFTGFGNYAYILDHYAGGTPPDELRLNVFGTAKSTVSTSFELYADDAEHAFIVRGKISGGFMEYCVSYNSEIFAQINYVLSKSETYNIGRYFGLNGRTGASRASHRINSIIVDVLK